MIKANNCLFTFRFGPANYRTVCVTRDGELPDIVDSITFWEQELPYCISPVAWIPITKNQAEKYVDNNYHIVEEQ